MTKISPPTTTPNAIWFTRLLAAAAVFLLPVSSVLAQATATWTGGGGNASTGTSGNWSGTAPVGTGERDLVFDASEVVASGRQTVNFNQNITITHVLMKREDTDTYGGFNLSSASFTNAPTLKGNIDVVSGVHTNNLRLTVLTNSTWDIAEGASLLRGTGLLTFGEEYTITKTGGGLLTLAGATSAGLGGTFLVQEGVLRFNQTNSDLSLNAATIALNGGTFDLRVDAARTNAASTTSLLGNSTLRMSRTADGEGLTHEMGALQLGSGTLRVETDDTFTSGTAGWTFGATTLSNNATLEVVNGTAALTRVTLGAVGETGGAYGLTKSGDGELVLSGANTYTGNTTIAAGAVRLAPNASFRFVVGAGGANNAVTGAGSFLVQGSFDIDLAAASTNAGATWVLVGTAAQSFDPEFSVSGFTESEAGLWSVETNGVTYQFSESTGLLSVAGGGGSPYDTWAAAYGLDPATAGAPGADPDGDSFDNASEFAFGTDPTMGNAALLRTTSTGGSVVITWLERTDASVSYTVQETTDLIAGPWSISAAVVTAGSGSTPPAGYTWKQVSVPAIGKKFYRVVGTY
jgi:autotransporter-associated beta strand protein